MTPTSDGKALVQVHARREGQFATAAGWFTLADLVLELRGVG